MSFGKWAKANWMILAFSGVALAAAPTAYVFSTKMHRTLVAAHQKKAQDDLTAIANYKAKYTIQEARQPKETAFELDAPLNKKLIDYFSAKREEIKAESASVGVAAMKFNEGEGAGVHKPLVENLFPKYPRGEQQVKQDAMVREYTQLAHTALLEQVKAGSPPAAERLVEQLNQTRETARTRAQSQGGRQDLTPEQTAALTKQLAQERINSYRRQAAALSFYADQKVFLAVPPVDQVTSQAFQATLTLAKFWDWQVSYWIHKDVMTAIAAANAQRGAGDPEGVAGSAVKRVLKVAVQQADYANEPDAASSSGVSTETAPTPADITPLDPAESLTGRKRSPENQFYDVRDVTLELVVSPHRLPALFDALAKTNFMTVLKCDLTDFDPTEDLKEGYYYGDEYVVRATIRVETIWLRSWTKKYMPDSVKRVLQVVEDKPVETEAPPPQ